MLVRGSVEVQSLATDNDGNATEEILRFCDLDSIRVGLAYDDIVVRDDYTEKGKFEFSIDHYTGSLYRLYVWPGYKRAFNNQIGSIFSLVWFYEEIVFPYCKDNPDILKLDSGPYPNPFSSSVRFRYAPLDTLYGLIMNIYDRSGNRVTWFTGVDSIPGEHEVEWNGRDRDNMECPAGVYFASFYFSRAYDYRQSFYQTAVKE